MADPSLPDGVGAGPDEPHHSLLSRRAFVGAAMATPQALLGGCSESPARAAPHQAALAGSVPAARPTPEAVSAARRPPQDDAIDDFLQRHPLPARYRHQQAYLLQGVPARELAPRIPGGQPMHWDQFGPTHRYVDMHTGWPWTRPGGDWIDANGVRHGSAPWFAAPVGDRQGSEASAYYSVDATRLVKQAQASRRWLAVLLTAPTAPRVIAGTVGSTHPPPSIEVTYADGQRARLRCWLAAGLDPSTELPNTSAAAVKLPAVLEFERPARAVTSASLNFTVTAHWSGANPQVLGFLLDPPTNQQPVRQGLASSAGRLDDGLQDLPDVIGVHRYTDQRNLADFVQAERASISSEHEFDPAIWGQGRENRSKWPHVGAGKWLNAGPPWSWVRSDHKQEGFAPLAPGLGAMRIHMPAAAIRDGAVVGYDGTLAAHAMILLPEPLFGRLDHIFVRYYVRLGLPGVATPRQRLQVQHVPGQTNWTSLTGKFGIGPDHSTSLGGVSGTSGGGAGWQMRLGWSECDALSGGPDERGWAPGFHLTDFQANNPLGHRYGIEQLPHFDRWGQQGGAGGMLYAGHWYCVETELKLNTVLTAQPGYAADGALRTWLDGRQVFEQTGLVFRSLPLASAPYRPDRIRPCRELGVRGLWMNFFHGGKTVNTIDRTVFYTGLAWAKRYIGPMLGIG